MNEEKQVEQKCQQEMLGDRIKIIRRGLGLNQNEFAKLLGVKQSTISNLERNAREMSNDILRKLYKLGYPAEWILYGETNNEFNQKSILEVLNRLGINHTYSYNKEFLEVVEMLQGLTPNQLTYVKGVIVGLKLQIKDFESKQK